MIGNFDDLLKAASQIPPKRVIVVSPGNAETFEAICTAGKRLPATFVLVGDQEAIDQGLAAQGGSGTGVEIVHQPDNRKALCAGIDLARDGKGDLLLKGSVDTATLMKAVLDERAGLRTGRLLSDVFVAEYPPRTGNKFIMITDGGLVLAPDLKDKIELINNAVTVAHALGNPTPRVAILSATEFVIPNLQSTLDAAALSKMNERGQIKGCIVDGPLALDNAISTEAMQNKGIASQVAGRAEILVAANIEAANSLAKSTTYFAGLRLAHVIVGSRIPILIPSRADRSDAKLLSIALGMVLSDYQARTTRD